MTYVPAKQNCTDLFIMMSKILNKSYEISTCITKISHKFKDFVWCIVVIGLNFFVSDIKGLNSYWIGIYRKYQNTSAHSHHWIQRQGWMWPDNSMVKYQNWANNEPSGHHLRKCGLLRNGQWLNRDCTSTYPYICELEMTRTTGNDLCVKNHWEVLLRVTISNKWGKA